MMSAAGVGFIWQATSLASSVRELSQQPAEQHGGPANSEAPSSIRQAAAAEIQAAAAVWQMSFNVLGLFGLGATVYYANLAWREAEKSADAAHKTLVQGARQSVHELRAYVFPLGVEIGGRIGPNAPIPEIKIDIKNTGQTPAYQMRSSATAMFAPIGHTPENFAPEDIVDVLGPGASFSKVISTADTLSDHDYEGITSGVMTIIFFGYIKYRSFGDERFTHFQYRYDHKSGDLIICPTGNSADEQAHD